MHFQIDDEKIREEAPYDGKWVLLTNTDLPTCEVAGARPSPAVPPGERAPLVPLYAANLLFLSVTVPTSSCPCTSVLMVPGAKRQGWRRGCAERRGG